ncbi:MAG TPA: TatD family hydrolase, partial [Candidatus Saccharimonadales bacterium]
RKNNPSNLFIIRPKMELVDTHCHIHRADYNLPADEVIASAKEAGVSRMICVGTDENDSRQAIDFVQGKPGLWASIGLHPHDAKLGEAAFSLLAKLIGQPKVVAIGECGLDYYYSYSSKEDQLKALRFQLDLAAEHNLPLIFHIREAFDDFWPVLDSYDGLKGVVHSFTAGQAELDQILRRGLFVGTNGIMTFSQDKKQLEAAKSIPLDRLLLETDSPFLTPPPYRGKVNQPKYTGLIAQFMAKLRQEDVHALAEATTANALKLFGLKDV